MQIRYSLYNLVRAWRKTLAFFLLLTMLTAALGLSAGVCQTAGDFLTRCRDNYVTIAQLEYKSAQIFETDYSPAAAEAAQMLCLPDYVQWEPASTAFGNIQGVQQKGMGTPAEDAVVMRVKVSSDDPYDEAQRVYRVYEEESYYARRDFKRKMLYLETDAVLEAGHSYLVYGFCYKSNWVAQYTISPTAFESPTALAAGLDGDAAQMLVDVTGREESCLTDNPYFAQLAEYCRATADSLLVTATADLENLYPFHENIHNLSEGTGFRAGDGNVLVLSRELAKAQNLAVGDQVRLKLSVRSGCGVFESYWPGNGFDHEETYTIIGLFEGPMEARLRVYIPSDAAPQLMTQAQNGPILGQAVVPNDRAEEFYLSMESQLPDGVQLTLYDQGYAAAAAPFADILRAARLILLACAAVGLAILTLFGYLFVYRQRDVMENMHRLGVSDGAAALYFLSGAGMLAFLAAGTGVGLAQLLSERVTELVKRLLSQYQVLDTRYSVTTIGVRKGIAFTPTMEWWVFGITALLVWLCAMGACLIFAKKIQGRNGRRKAARRRRGLSRSLRGGPWKFAWLSLLRGGGRTMAPLCVLLCAVVLLGLLPFAAQDYDRRRAELEANTTILGYYTNSTGRMVEEGMYPADQLEILDRAEQVDNVTVSQTQHYALQSYFDGEQHHGDDMEFWSMSEYQRSCYKVQLLRGPRLIAANRLPLTPEFRYEANLKLRWLEGYDETSLDYESLNSEQGTTEDGGTYIMTRMRRCVVSERFLAEHGLELGNIISLSYIALGDDRPSIGDFLIIGAYSSSGDGQSIYVELGHYLYDKHFFLLDLGGEPVDHSKITFHSAAFTVPASHLTETRDTLEELGYSKIGDLSGQRRWVVLDDRIYLDTRQAMDQRLRYMELLFPVVYAMTELLALAASYLLTMNHKKDLAVMRSQGASRWTGFGSLFFHQLLLCAVGAGIGCGILALTHTWTRMGAILIAAFAALWLLGSSVSILRMNRREIVQMMKSAE